jgi:hypothetical protein
MGIESNFLNFQGIRNGRKFAVSPSLGLTAYRPPTLLAVLPSYDSRHLRNHAPVGLEEFIHE